MHKKISQIIAEHKDKSVLLTNPKDICYLTGASFEGFWLLLYKNNIFAVTSKMAENQVKRYFKNKIKVFAGLSFADTLTAICKKHGINKICVDETNTNLRIFSALNGKLEKNKISLSKTSGLTNGLRIIKDKNEIRNIQKACDIVSKVYEKIKKQISAGMTESDVRFKIEEEFARNHVTPGFKTIVASGPNSSDPHHASGKRKILKNDMILIDMGCEYNGYCSDLTRIVFLDKIRSDYKKIWSLVKKAHDESLLSVKAGAKCGDIDKIARNIIKLAGFGNNFIHTLGHGVGLDIHEQPSVSEHSKEVLKEGMVITIEPGIYFQNKFGIRIEDTVLVTKHGYKILTSAKY